MTPEAASSNGPTEPVAPRQVVDAIRRLRAPIMVSHVVPDADALGSMLAMASAWTSKDCQPTVALPAGSLSQRLSFLFEWTSAAVATAEDFSRADGFVVLDTAKKGRCNVGADLKKTDWSGDRPIINVDHHATNTRFGTVNWIVEDAGSTAELVFFLLRDAERPIDATIASLLLAGIQTDTLGFSLPTTTASAFTAAAALVRAGARVGELGERLARSLRQSEFDLLRVIYANTKTMAGGRIAYGSASYEEIHGAGCAAADIDDQINVPRSLKGVELAMLFTEGRKGKTRINFRSAGDVTVLDLAAEFGGGGHAQAAGAVLDCGLDEAMERVVTRALEHLKRFPS